MNRCDGVHRCGVAAMLITVFALARVCAAQDETQTPREAVEQKQPTTISSYTIYPVPNYGGGFLLGSFFFGDLGGGRSEAPGRGTQVLINVKPDFLWVGHRGHDPAAGYRAPSP